MKKALLAGILLLGAAASHAAPPGQMLSLSCVEGLVAIERPELSGVFSFVAEKDVPAAFADLLAHDKKALKKFVSKLEADHRLSSSLTAWDHEVALTLVSLYGSPLGETLEKPKPAVINRLSELAAAPAIPLEQMTARRRK